MLAERVKEWETRWLTKGEQEGERKGQQKGEQKGRADVLLRQLDRKFGPLDAATQQQIAETDADRLLDWSDRVLTAERLEDVLD